MKEGFIAITRSCNDRKDLEEIRNLKSILNRILVRVGKVKQVMIALFSASAVKSRWALWGT